jgi:GT2 family glycosyltransferase
LIDVSICIVNWNAAGLLRDCLHSIFGQEGRTSLEVIVVDNASTDDSVAMVRGEFPRARLIANSENVGFARANNQAFKVARGRYLLLLNNDTVVMPGAIDTMARFADRHPEAGMVGCKLLNPDGSLQPSCRTFPSLGIMFFRALYLDKLFPGNRWAGANYMSYWDHNTIREVDVIQGSCMFVRREVLEQVGPLDERFFMYYEETDWCYRTKQRGWKIYFTPEAEIIHYGGQSSSRQSAKMSVVYHQSLLGYFRKHHGRLVYVVVRLLSIVETSLRLAYWSLSSLLRWRKRAQATYKIVVYWPALRWLLRG